MHQSIRHLPHKTLLNISSFFLLEETSERGETPLLRPLVFCVFRFFFFFLSVWWYSPAADFLSVARSGRGGGASV